LNRIIRIESIRIIIKFFKEFDCDICAWWN